MECAVVSITFWISVVTIGVNLGVSVWAWLRHRRFERGPRPPCSMRWMSSAGSWSGSTATAYTARHAASLHRAARCRRTLLRKEHLSGTYGGVRRWDCPV